MATIVDERGTRVGLASVGLRDFLFQASYNAAWRRSSLGTRIRYVMVFSSPVLALTVAGICLDLMAGRKMATWTSLGFTTGVFCFIGLLMIARRTFFPAIWRDAFLGLDECPGCRYDLSGATDTDLRQCSECGGVWRSTPLLTEAFSLSRRLALFMVVFGMVILYNLIEGDHQVAMSSGFTGLVAVFFTLQAHRTLSGRLDERRQRAERA